MSWATAEWTAWRFGRRASLVVHLRCAGMTGPKKCPDCRLKRSHASMAKEELNITLLVTRGRGQRGTGYDSHSSSQSSVAEQLQEAATILGLVHQILQTTSRRSKLWSKLSGPSRDSRDSRAAQTLASSQTEVATLRKELADLEAQDSLRAYLLQLQTLMPQDHLQEAHTHLESFISLGCKP